MIKVREKSMLFIEAHAHVWNRLNGRRLDKDLIGMTCGQIKVGDQIVQFLPPEFEDCRSSIEVFKLYEKLLGFDKVVLLQTPCYGPQYDYINEIIINNPDKYVTVGVPNPQDKNSYMKTAKLCLGEYKYKGLKFECPDIPFDMVAKENAFVFETIQNYGAYCMIDLGWGKGPNDFPISALETVVTRYPDLTFIIPHLGISHLWDPNEHKNYNTLKRTMALLEKNENIWFDLSGIPMMVNSFDEYPYPKICNALKVVKDSGALNHVMWGSDYPTVLSACTYRQHIDFVIKHCDFMSDDEIENVMGKTAQKVWFE